MQWSLIHYHKHWLTGNVFCELIHKYLHRLTKSLPWYSDMCRPALDKHSRVISLTRSMRMKNLDWQAMHELTSGLAEMILILRN
jgi:hypothetical protein